MDVKKKNESEKRACIDKIRNKIMLNLLASTRSNLIFILERYTDFNKSDMPSEEIIDMIRKLDKIIIKFLVEKSGETLAKKIDIDIIKKLEKEFENECED